MIHNGDHMIIDGEHTKDFFLTAEKGFSNGGKLKDICKHGKCQYRKLYYDKSLMIHKL